MPIIIPTMGLLNNSEELKSLDKFRPPRIRKEVLKKVKEHMNKYRARRMPKNGGKNKFFSTGHNYLRHNSYLKFLIWAPLNVVEDYGDESSLLFWYQMLVSIFQKFNLEVRV